MMDIIPPFFYLSSISKIRNILDYKLIKMLKICI